jgi:hypothetical protein
MKIITLLLFAFGFFKPSFAQIKNIPTKCIDNLWHKELYCFDSSGNKVNECSTGLAGLSVNFSKASLNKSTGDFTLEGRVLPMPAVGIYISCSEKIQPNQALAYTSYDSVMYSKCGYFNITFVLTPKQVLYLYHPNFYVRQYDIYKLMEK